MVGCRFKINFNVLCQFNLLDSFSNRGLGNNDYSKIIGYQVRYLLKQKGALRDSCFTINSCGFSRKLDGLKNKL